MFPWHRQSRSNESLSLFEEMRAFTVVNREVTREDFEMITVNPASALRQQNTLGRIAPGFRADLIAIPRSKDRIYSEKSWRSMGD